MTSALCMGYTLLTLWPPPVEQVDVQPSTKSTSATQKPSPQSPSGFDQNMDTLPC
jgi:hypothetical protein